MKKKKNHYLRQQQKVNRQKRKRENKNKIERHSAEQKWKVKYYNDLDLQLKFRNIEYVDVICCKKFRPISETYVKELREEHQDTLEKKGWSKKDNRSHIR